jgi:hypothetical protein
MEYVGILENLVNEHAISVVGHEKALTELKNIKLLS